MSETLVGILGLLTIVAILEARDGTILDVVRKIKPYTVDQE